jgi:hypothetical protein
MSTKHTNHTKNDKGIVVRMSIGVNNAPVAVLKFKLPDSLKPSPLNLILKPLSTGFPELEKKDIYFETIDFDAY